MRVRGGRIGAVAVLALMALPGTAGAYYGNGAQIISADFGRLEQADDTTFYAAASDGGRYVAFETFARNLFPDGDADPPGQYRQGGIFRFDLETRGLQLVADGNLRNEDTNALLVRGARNPSVDADGRHIAFSTAQRLVPQDTNGNIDVYVRDMEVPIRQPGAYDLVSARDGGDLPASYAPRPQPTPGLDPGSDLAPGEAMSADGSRVAFRTLEGSDLPARAGIESPPNQILVRDRASNTTRLVTRNSSDGEPAGGAAGAAGMSADGSTVAWAGGNAPAQTRFLSGESSDSGLIYYLWRRVADGPSAPTRRLTGIADPDDSACPSGGGVVPDTSSTGPCYGPLAEQEGIPANISGQVPALGADGRRVTFLTGSPPRNTVGSAAGLDLFLTDMSPGVSRKAGTVELTRDRTARDIETSAPISSLAMSSDGRFAAITTSRIRFILPTLRLVGAGRVAAGPSELYVIDLEGRTVERATRAADGGEIDSDVSDGPTLSSDGGRIAFTSFAGNFFFGDGNRSADGFVITRQSEPGESPPPPPQDNTGVGSVEDLGGSGGGPRVTARARSLRNGKVEVIVRVPGAGGLKAEARSRVGRPRRQRSLAVRTARSARAGRVRIVLTPVRRYRREVRRRKRVLARVSIGYVASRGGRRLRTSVRATFRRPARRKSRNSPRSPQKR